MESQTTFITKLFNMINTDSTRHIYWSKNGSFFVVPDPASFSTLVLSSHFKHSNFASFVRQLNMYGFRKIADMSQLSEVGDLPGSWSFEHPNFLKGRPDLLDSVQRKPKSPKKRGDSPVKDQHQTPSQLKQRVLLDELIHTRKQQSKLQAQFQQMHKQRQAAWKEYLITQEKLREQQDTSRKVLAFFATICQQQFFPHTRQQTMSQFEEMIRNDEEQFLSVNINKSNFESQVHQLQQLQQQVQKLQLPALPTQSNEISIKKEPPTIVKKEPQPQDELFQQQLLQQKLQLQQQLQKQQQLQQHEEYRVQQQKVRQQLLNQLIPQSQSQPSLQQQPQPQPQPQSQPQPQPQPKIQAISIQNDSKDIEIEIDFDAFKTHGPQETFIQIHELFETNNGFKGNEYLDSSPFIFFSEEDFLRQSINAPLSWVPS